MHRRTSNEESKATKYQRSGASTLNLAYILPPVSHSGAPDVNVYSSPAVFSGSSRMPSFLTIGSLRGAKGMLPGV